MQSCRPSFCKICTSTLTTRLRIRASYQVSGDNNDGGVLQLDYTYSFAVLSPDEEQKHFDTFFEVGYCKYRIAGEKVVRRTPPPPNDDMKGGENDKRVKT